MKAAAFWRLPICVLGLLILTACVILASPDDRGTFRIEIFGGFSTLTAGDLNKRVEFDRLVEDYETELRYSYYNNAYGNFVTYSGRIDGEFNKIDSALPFGLRVRYTLNSFMSVSVGLKHLSSRRESRVSYLYDVRMTNPDAFQFYDDFSLTRVYDPYSLSVEAFVPMVGFHYRIWETGLFGFEAFAAAGPMFARCKYSSQRISRNIDSYEYETETDTTQEMEGTGTGIAFDVGLQMNLNLTKGLGLLFEGGYAAQYAGNISGPGRAESTTLDSNSAGYTESSDWDGRWAMIEGSFNQEWGNIPFSYPTNQHANPGLTKFKLDLSGFQIRIGLLVRL